MNSRALILVTICLLAVGAGGCRDGQAHKEDRIFDDQALDFFSKLDTEAMRMLAAQFGGRKSGALDSAAHDEVARITGSEKPDGVEPVVAYLEFYFNTGQYLSRPVIFVRSRQLRTIVADNLKGTHLEVFGRTNRIPPVTIMLGSGDTVTALASQNEFVRDMVLARRITAEDARSARPIGTLGDRWSQLLDRKNFRVLLGRLSGRYEALLSIELRLLPGEGPDWPVVSESLVPSGQHTHSAGCELMVNLRDAWKKRDASGVNAVIGSISQAGAAASEDYPKASRLRWELFYNDAHKGHPAFAGFVVAFLLFIVAIATQRRGVRNCAMAILMLSTAVIGGAWVLRWIIGGEKWYLPPMMTQYGAMVSSAVLATVLAIVVELFRKYNYIALAASFYAAAVLVWVYFGNTLFPGTVDSSVSGVRGILKDPLMIIHVSVIVVGHALAGMTVVTSVAYVAIAYSKGVGKSHSPQPGPFGMVVYVATACFRGVEGKSPSSPPGLFGPVGDSALASADRCNLILAQGACWTLIAGTLLGAWWADYAWSRWWGWDPKETWALITCLFFLAVLHVRLVTPSKYRGLLTAVICILGGLAMLFNWFVVNYVFSGLHSYG